MKKLSLMIAATALAINVSGAQAEQANTAVEAKQGATVFGSAVVGFIAGGPIGFAAGAIAGGYFADNIKGAAEAEELSETLDATELALAETNRALSVSEESLTKQRQQHKQMVSSLEMALSLDLRFALAETELSQRDEERLEQIAQLLINNPYLQLEITGYTDQLGDEAYNLALSAERAEVVKSKLVALGVDEYQLAADGRGEIKAQSPEQYAEHRRASIKLNTVKSQVAQN